MIRIKAGAAGFAGRGLTSRRGVALAMLKATITCEAGWD